MVREKLQHHIADIVTDLILNDMQKEIIERIVR